jgi:hypothetical protein
MRIEHRKAVSHDTTREVLKGCTDKGPISAYVWRALQSLRILWIGAIVPPQGQAAKEVLSKRFGSSPCIVENNTRRVVEVRSALSKLPSRNRLRLSAQSLAACVIAALFVGCGSGGKPAMAADYVPVHLYYVAHPDGLTACQVAEAWAYAQEAFDRAGVPVAVMSVTEVTDFGYSNFDDPRYQYERRTAAGAWLRKHNIDTSWSVHYFFLPALICEGGQKCYGGMASGVCKVDGGVAIGQSGAWSGHNPPRDRIYSSGIIAAHEIGHLVGASHRSTLDAGDSRDYPPSIMDLAAGRFVDSLRGKLWFLPESSAEMRGCVPFAKKRAITLCKQNYRKNPLKMRRCLRVARRKAPVLRSGGDMHSEVLFY